MESTTVNYNLLEEEWIPVLFHNGKYSRVGIRSAFANAGEIRQIAASNPMDRVAILRFLLAVLYWCKGNPPDDMNEIPKNSFPADWFVKLDDNKECFNLLGNGKRFYQYPSRDKKLSVNYLVHEVPTGTNAWHFRHSTDKKDGLCPVCCAIGLLRLPVFATSGGRGKPPAINSKPPIYVIPVGSSLSETLLLSWRREEVIGRTAFWETPDLKPPRNGVIPFLTGLTWVPRRIWLDDSARSEGKCISCGKVDGLIRTCVFSGVGSMKTDGDNEGMIWRDPHVLCTNSNKNERMALYSGDSLRSSDASAGQWKRILDGILEEIVDDLRISKCDHFWLVGFSTVKNDKYLEAIEWLIPHKHDLTQTEKLRDKIKELQKEEKNVVKLARKALYPNKSSSEQKEVLSTIANTRSHIENQTFLEIASLQSEHTDHRYQSVMKMIAQSLSPGATVRAVRRRKRMVEYLPRESSPKKRGES